MRSVLGMDDEELMCHLERFHPGDLRLKFQVEPGRTERYLAAPELWRTYHDTLHRLYPNNYEHTHEVHMEKLNHDVKWGERTEDIWVLTRTGDADHVDSAYTTPEAAEFAAARGDQPWGTDTARITLHRPSLQPIYGGPTLMEALWGEMDRLMEALMTGADAEDGGDKYRAQELAWVIAVVSNPYDPSVDRVRAEAMDRWNKQQEVS